MKRPFKLWQILPNLRVLREDYGGRFPLIVLRRFVEYLYFVLFKRGEFEFNNNRYPYFYHLYNPTFRCERCVEIPIILSFFDKDARVLEVGNVLMHYTELRHDVVDKYEEVSDVINEDIVSFRPGKQYDLIVSISTLEHVGWDEDPKEATKIEAALDNMRSLLKPGGRMVFTVPIGYNNYLDRLLEKSQLGLTETYFMKRISRDNRWHQTTYDEVRDCRYHDPYFGASAITIGLFQKPQEAAAHINDSRDPGGESRDQGSLNIE